MIDLNDAYGFLGYFTADYKGDPEGEGLELNLCEFMKMSKELAAMREDKTEWATESPLPGHRLTLGGIWIDGEDRPEQHASISNKEYESLKALVAEGRETK